MEGACRIAESYHSEEYRLNHLPRLRSTVLPARDGQAAFLSLVETDATTHWTRYINELDVGRVIVMTWLGVVFD